MGSLFLVFVEVIYRLYRCTPFFLSFMCVVPSFKLWCVEILSVIWLKYFIILYCIPFCYLLFQLLAFFVVLCLFFFFV